MEAEGGEGEMCKVLKDFGDTPNFKEHTYTNNKDRSQI